MCGYTVNNNTLLFSLQTSAALQSKMEKVEQQLTHSMNGYHLGIHLKKDAAVADQQQTQSSSPKCPMEDLGNKKPPSGNSNAVKKSNDEDIASSYFQVRKDFDEILNCCYNNWHLQCLLKIDGLIQ